MAKCRTNSATGYVYADELPAPKPEKNAAKGLSKENMAALPEVFVNRLHQAVLSADLDQMLEIIRQIEEQDSVVAGRLRSLAENFEYQKLLGITAAQNKELK